MNKVLFICLLSLSICFSSAVGKEEKPVPTVPVPIGPPGTVNKSQPAVAPTEAAKVPEHVTTAPTNKTAPEVHPANATSSATAPTHNDTTQTKNQTASPTIDNKTDNKTVKPDENKTEPATEKLAISTTTKPDDKKDATTEKSPSTVKPTLTPKADDKQNIVLQSRAFDGPSFIGGIILTLSMLAVGFIGFRYYRSQTERNYHTL